MADPTYALEDGRADVRKPSVLTPNVFLDIVRALDAVVILAASGLGFLLFAVPFRDMIDEWASVSAVTILGMLLGGFVLSSLQVYSIQGLKRVGRHWMRCSAAWTVTLAFVIVIGFLTKTSDQFSRGWLLLWWGLTIAGFAVVRIGAYRALLSWQASGRLRRAVAIVGATEQAQRIKRFLQENARNEATIVGVFDDVGQRGSDEFERHLSGDIDDLIAYSRERHVDQIFIAVPLSEKDRLGRLADRLRVVPASIELDLDIVGRAPIGRMADELGMPVLHMIDKPLRDWHGIVKAVFDRAFAAFALLLLAPLMLVVGAAVKLDSPGPVFFRQARFGFKNRSTTVYKFRTMYMHLGDPSGAQQTRLGDPRVTRVGAFLRRSNLDELPQLINVLQGRMSVVGPRPHPLTMRAADQLYHEAVDGYAVRHRVKPGITGWAQVRGLRGETDTFVKAEARIAHDLYYIDNWSILFDLKIIAMTVLRMFRDPNAY